MPNLSIFQGLTGRKGSPTGGNVRDMIIGAFGTTKRGGPNTRAAAESLGVSQQRPSQRSPVQPARQGPPGCEHEEGPQGLPGPVPLEVLRP